MSGQHYDPVEILRIEMAVRTIQDDALGRYIHDPRNLDRIMAIMRQTLAALLEVRADPVVKCPPGYVHKDCSCVVDIRQPPTG